MLRLFGFVILGLLLFGDARADDIAVLPTAISGQMPNKPGWKAEFDERLAARVQALGHARAKQIAPADLECLEAACFGGIAARANASRAVRGLVYYLGTVGYQVRFLVDDGGKGKMLEAKCQGCNELKVAELLLKLFGDALASGTATAPPPTPVAAPPKKEEPPPEPAPPPKESRSSSRPQRFDSKILALTLGTGVPLLAAGVGGVIGLGVQHDYFLGGGSTGGKVLFGTFTAIAGASIIVGIVDFALLFRFGRVDDGANR